MRALSVIYLATVSTFVFAQRDDIKQKIIPVFVENENRASYITVKNGKPTILEFQKIDTNWLYFSDSIKIKRQQNVEDNAKKYPEFILSPGVVTKSGNSIVYKNRSIKITTPFDGVRCAYSWGGYVIVDVSVPGSFGTPMNGTFLHSALIFIDESTQGYTFIDTGKAFYPLVLFVH